MLLGLAQEPGSSGSKVPSSFLPDEDQGYLYINLQLQSAASHERTDLVEGRLRMFSLTLREWQPRLRSRLQFTQLYPIYIQRVLLVPLNRGTNAPTAETQFQVIKAPAESCAQSDSRRHRFDFSPPAIPAWAPRRIHIRPRDRAGKELQFSGRQLEHIHGSCPQASGDRGSEHHVPGQRCLSSSSTWTATRSSNKPSLSAMFTGPFRRLWRSCSSTIQPLSVASGRFTSRPRALPNEAENVGQFYVRNQNGRWFRSPH